MRVVVVYESMYGNTHHVANAIATGLGLELSLDSEILVVPANDAIRETIEGCDLLIVGGPTHVHGMSRASTREAAVANAGKPESGLELDPDAEGPGLRDWFDSLDRIDGPAAAFDTRAPGPAILTGRASKGIASRLDRHGAKVMVEPESFVVTKDNHLEIGEETRARTWGTELALLLVKGASVETHTQDR